MKQFLTAILFSCATIAIAQAQPAISAGGIQNSGSYAPGGLPNAAIAQGSLFVVKGNNLGPATVQIVPAYPLPTTLGNTSISVTVNGTTTRPLMYYTSAKQLAALLPSSTPVGTGTLTVTYNGQTSATAPMTVAASSFGIYSANATGTGLGLITNASFQLIGPTAAANPGETLIIFGTGVGPTSGDESGPASGLTLAPVSVDVIVGGKSATIYGAARAPQFSGLDQIAFAVPAGITGCSVPVTVRIGTVYSNYVSLPIAAAGRTCSDPSGIGGPITATPTGVVSYGSIDLSRSSYSISQSGVSLSGTLDSASASFLRYTTFDYSSAANPFQLATYGSCTVFTFQGTSATTPVVTNTTYLDAGAALTVNGPGGSKTLTKMSGVYSNTTLGGGFTFPGAPAPTPLYLTKGTYTVTGPGGADVGPFTATLNIADPLTWTNSGITTVNRAAGQLITWTGGDPAGNTYIFGASIAGTSSSSVGAEFVCVERTSAQQFTIPAAVLLSLPATSTTLTSAGTLAVESSTSATFKASGLDQAAISSTSITLKNPTYQ